MRLLCYDWPDEVRFDQILPCNDGQAVKYVFSLLQPAVLSKYRNLIDEMNNRYKVIEMHRLFVARFSRRNQKSEGIAEEFVAEFKGLYDKAHVLRDRKRHEEDLVHKFLDGPHEDEVCFEVE